MINQRQQILNLLGLARRAGQLVTGEGMVLTALQKDQVRIVLLASDAGQATIKKVTDKCQTHQVRVVNDFTRLEISQAIGQGAHDRGNYRGRVCKENPSINNQTK